MVFSAPKQVMGFLYCLPAGTQNTTIPPFHGILMSSLLKFLIPPKAHSIWQFERNWVKTIKAIRGVLLSTGFAREMLQDRDSPRMLQNLLGLGEQKAGTGASYHMPLSQVICTQSLLTLNNRTKRSDKFICLFSLRKRYVQHKQGGRKDGASLEVLISHMSLSQG